MPGIVLFGRRWTVADDDFVIPCAILLLLHLPCLIVCAITLTITAFPTQDGKNQCHQMVFILLATQAAFVGVHSLLEICIFFVSLRGSILDPSGRTSVPLLLYLRYGAEILNFGFSIFVAVWLGRNMTCCHVKFGMEALLGLTICSFLTFVFQLVLLWCAFDSAGKSWVNMQRFQSSLLSSHSRYRHKRHSGSFHRTWRHRKVIRAYRSSWSNRCQLIFCCMRDSKSYQHSFAEIGQLFSDYFADLDVVPTDVVAGLILLRRYQIPKHPQLSEELPSSQFLNLSDPLVNKEYVTTIHYLRYAMAAYGWPIYLMLNPFCCGCQLCCRARSELEIVDDNCCNCHSSALSQMCDMPDTEISYANFHVDVGETPFFVAIDHARKTVVIAVRGTLSMKGMVNAAKYIFRKLQDEGVLEAAFSKARERSRTAYGLVVLGHSLGAGTAAILAILLKTTYANLRCYAFSPPAGLLSRKAAEYTKSFVLSVVVGKDVICRLGLLQMELLRADFVNALNKNKESKWTIFLSSVCCSNFRTQRIEEAAEQFACDRDEARSTLLDSDASSIEITRLPLYPPGKIIHVVRWHVGEDRPLYRALWADTDDFNEILISPGMIRDHLPTFVHEAMNKVIEDASHPSLKKSEVRGQDSFDSSSDSSPDTCVFPDAFYARSIQEWP